MGRRIGRGGAGPEPANGFVNADPYYDGPMSPSKPVRGGMPRVLLLVLFGVGFLGLPACAREEPARRGSGGALDGRGLDAPAEAAGRTGRVAPEVPDDAPLVVFLGDSLAAGLHLAADQAFPAVTQALLAEEGLPFRLVNAGVSGDTSAGGLARLDWLLSQEPDLLVLELGANDGLRGVSIASLRSNLREIIERTRAAGVPVLLLGLRLPPSYGEYATEFDAVYPALAEELDVPFVPFFMRGVGGVREMNLPDGLHPTPEGHELLAANVKDALGELLQSVADDSSAGSSAGSPSGTSDS